MIKFFKTVLLLFLIPLCSLAQDYVQVTHLDYAEDSGAGIVQIDDEGSAYVIMSSRYDINFYGRVFPRHNATDYSVIGKLSSSGKLLWSRTISATTGGDQIQNLQVDKDHNIYISGVGGGIQLDDGSILKSGIFLLKLNKDGKTQWGIISDDTSGSNLGGPIAITDDGVFWSAIFHGYLHLQGRVLNTNSPNMGTADAFTARVTADGKVTALYHDPAKSSLPTILVPSGNGMATAVFTQGVFNNHRVVLDANCKVISDDPFFAYGYSFPALRSITGGYQALSGVFIQKNGSVSNGSFYDFKFDKYLNITDSTKVFPNQATARTVYDAIAYNNRGYFIRSPSITPGAGGHQDWFFTTGKNDFTILPDENPTNSYYTQDAFSRSFVNVVGDTLNMVVRYYSPYGKTFTFNKKQYTTPSNVDLSYFWVKYIYKDPDSCKKITAVLLNNGSEGSSDVRIKLKLPKSCPAQEDVVLNTQLTDPASNQNDFALPPQVTIKKGETETELVLKVADDRYIENLESFSLSFTAAANPSGYLMSPANGPVKFTITITDNDNTPFNKRCNITYSPDIREGTSGTVTVSLPDTVLLSYPLTLTFQKDSEVYQATENTDYTPLKLTIPAGSNKVQFSIDAFKDQVIEGDEYISGSLAISKNEIIGFNAADSLVRIRITDEDNTGDNMVITVTPRPMY